MRVIQGAAVPAIEFFVLCTSNCSYIPLPANLLTIQLWYTCTSASMGGAVLLFISNTNLRFFSVVCINQSCCFSFSLHVEAGRRGVPLFASTRVIVYRSVSLQLGRAAPLIIKHAVLFLATANYNHNRFLHCWQFTNPLWGIHQCTSSHRFYSMRS